MCDPEKGCVTPKIRRIYFCLFATSAIFLATRDMLLTGTYREFIVQFTLDSSTLLLLSGGDELYEYERTPL